MPVPVPRVSKQSAHPVVKKCPAGPNPFQSLTCSLPVSPPGPPPSFGTREEWINSLPTWRRTKPRRIWEEEERIAGRLAGQGFYSGDSQWSSSSFGMDVDYQSQLAISTNSSPSDHVHSYDHHVYERGAFTPVFEDQSPGAYSGPDAASSPIGPVTPFGEFVDRAVAAEEYATYGESLSAKSQAAQQEHCGSVHQSYDAAAEFRSHARLNEDAAAAPAPEAVTPTATSGYRKLAEPLSDWVANYVWKACSTGFSLPSAFSRPSGNVVQQRPSSPPSYLGHAVHSLLLSTLLQPSAVFLALWYIVRLPVYYDAAALGPDYVKELRFRAALLGNGLDQDVNEASAPFRLIVLGCMLANKWLDDHTFSNKTWHTISSVPIQTLNKLESLALDIFAYDLSVPSADWSQWLTHLVSYHQLSSSPSHPQPISRPSTNPHAIVRKALDEIIQAPAASNFNTSSPQPAFMGLEERRRERMEKEQQARALEIDLDEDGPLREEYLPKRRFSAAGSTRSSFNSHDAPPPRATAVEHVDLSQNWHGQTHTKVVEKALPPPARWSPAADEPILRERNRASGHYVAVQPPILPSMMTYQIAPSYRPPHDMGYPNQNWPPATAFVAVKPPVMMGMGYVFDAPPLHVAHPAAYATPAYPFVAPASHLALSHHQHSRSQSLSYDQDNSHSRNRVRSCSQSQAQPQFEYHVIGCGELTAPGHEASWGAAPAPAAHYGYPAPAYPGQHHAHMQPAWVRT
ncbi:hypothetical protein MSAN_01422900 [Mycena sanguinolenta]|uniref:Cyclin N-terminal domain-containing protein n=1 Tax=Mycena sanguinolenta TaxID=230812 RepID=A0A8H7CYB2_9AGAR|nr:hypothetical protein MSAN_01422900 [Mycena sanguinolenta]